MAKNTPKKTMTPFEKTLTAIITLVILAVLAFAVFATYGRISENINEKRIEEETAAISSGEKPATIRYMASSMGMTAEEYAAQYGVELTDGLKESSEISDMIERMTVENYFKFNDENTSEQTDIDAKLAEWGADELGITKDTLWGELQKTLSIGKYMGEDEFNDLISQYESYGYDVSTVTADMSIKDANDAIEKIMNNGPVNEPATADDTAADGEEAPAE